MCLDKITQGPDPLEEGVGWKVFQYRAIDGDLVGVFSLSQPIDSISFTPSFRSGEWLCDERSYEIQADNNEYYQTGFHFFRNKADAELIADIFGGILRQVRYKQVTAKGDQKFLVCHDPDKMKYEWEYFPSLVAREIFIEDEEQKECA
jgi:hypothetical protein